MTGQTQQTPRNPKDAEVLTCREENSSLQENAFDPLSIAAYPPISQMRGHPRWRRPLTTSSSAGIAPSLCGPSAAAGCSTVPPSTPTPGFAQGRSAVARDLSWRQ